MGFGKGTFRKQTPNGTSMEMTNIQNSSFSYWRIKKEFPEEKLLK